MLKRFTPTSNFNTLSGDCRDMSEAGLLFDGKVKPYLPLPPNIFSRIWHKVVHVYMDIPPIWHYHTPLRPAKLIMDAEIFQIISDNVRECPFWFRSFPRNVRENRQNVQKHAYNTKNPCLLICFSGITYSRYSLRNGICCRLEYLPLG